MDFLYASFLSFSIQSLIFIDQEKVGSYDVKIDFIWSMKVQMLFFGQSSAKL